MNTHTHRHTHTRKRTHTHTHAHARTYMSSFTTFPQKYFGPDVHVPAPNAIAIKKKACVTTKALVE